MNIYRPLALLLSIDLRIGLFVLPDSEILKYIYISYIKLLCGGLFFGSFKGLQKSVCCHFMQVRVTYVPITTPTRGQHPENNARSWKAPGCFAEGFPCLAGLPAHSTDSKVFIEQNDFLGIFLI